MKTKNLLLRSMCLVWGLGMVMGTMACRKQDKPIVILHDNDSHCEVRGFAKLAQLRNDMQAADTAYVGVVSSGDLMQGGLEGTLSQGQQVVDIMRQVGYDALVPGNHEFDYGTPRMLELMAQLGRERVSCVNLSDRDGKFFFPDYVMVKYGRTKVAYVGVLTPTTMRDEKAAFITNEGDTLYRLQTDEEVVRLTQEQINRARRAGARYVILLTHMGETDVPLTSIGLIERTYGADAVLDGHTHSKIPELMVKNLHGQEVPLTQTATKFAYIGKVYIGTDGRVRTSLIETASVQGEDPRVMAVIDSIDIVNAPVKNRPVGETEVRLTIMGEDGNRLVRKGETNGANLAADAARWACGTQLAMVNGGGIRGDYKAGRINFGDVINVQPFSNDYHVVEITGAQLEKVVAFGCSALKTEDLANNKKGELGDFVQPSGFRYTFSVPEDRVVSLDVLDEQTGQYVPVVPDKIYTIAVSQYSLGSYGDVLKQCPVLHYNVCVDNMATVRYIQEKLNGHVGQEYARPQGRVVIIK